MSENNLPLSRFKVLDLTTARSGPTASNNWQTGVQMLLKSNLQEKLLLLEVDYLEIGMDMKCKIFTETNEV